MLVIPILSLRRLRQVNPQEFKDSRDGRETECLNAMFVSPDPKFI